jgi:hypothetical protein
MALFGMKPTEREEQDTTKHSSLITVTSQFTHFFFYIFHREKYQHHGTGSFFVINGLLKNSVCNSDYTASHN